IVQKFAKRTGDYCRLSATDIKIIALTYMLEVETNGKKNLKPLPEGIDLSGIKRVTVQPYQTTVQVKQQESIKSSNEESNEEVNEETNQQVNEETNKEVNEESNDGESSDDEGEWITPENI